MACYDAIPLPDKVLASAVAGSQDWTGSGATTTRPFTMPGPWEVQWNSRGDIFQIYLKQADGGLSDILANQMGPGSGQAYVPRGGTFLMTVNTVGRWTLHAVPVSSR